MEVPEHAMDSGTVTTKQEAGYEGRRPLTLRIQGRSMEYRTLGRTGIKDGDAPFDDERQSGL
jgi:hypothetical protein